MKNLNSFNITKLDFGISVVIFVLHCHLMSQQLHWCISKDSILTTLSWIILQGQLLEPYCMPYTTYANPTQKSRAHFSEIFIWLVFGFLPRSKNLMFPSHNSSKTWKNLLSNQWDQKIWFWLLNFRLFLPSRLVTRQKPKFNPNPTHFLVSFNNSQSISTNGRVSDRYASTMCRSPGRGRTQASCGRISYKGIEDRCSIIISAVNYCIDKLLASSSS